jgi:hypothetical protein
MSNPRPKSIALGNGPQPRVYRTFEDWQAQQENDTRTPEERGIHVGSSVMWRRRQNKIIVTERATVTAISNNTLTLEVKDVETRTCKVDVREIVSAEITRPSVREINQQSL